MSREVHDIFDGITGTEEEEVLLQLLAGHIFISLPTTKRLFISATC